MDYKEQPHNDKQQTHKLNLLWIRCIAFSYNISNYLCSVFQNNVAITGGIIGVPYLPLVMDGHNVFTNNTGATLRVGSY